MSGRAEPPSAKPTGTAGPHLIYAILSLVGFTAIIAQIVLMRELIVVFYGNETSLGVMLANWLFWTAVGSSLLGHLTPRGRDPRNLMAALEILLAAALPVTILAARASKLAFQALPGEILGPEPMFLTSFVTLSLFCAISGGLFAAGSRLYAYERRASTAAATSLVYLLEAVGSGLGGLLASLLLIRLLTAFQIAALLAVLNLWAATSLAVRSPRTRRVAWAGVLAITLLLPYASRALETFSLAVLWRGFHLVETRNSIYGNLAVVETGESRSLFENGLRVLTVPDPAAAEEAVHFALLEHPMPRSLLLIGGGVNGSLTQALQHTSLERVDYVELDPSILDLAARHFRQEWAAIRADPRVRIHRTDGRLFLKTYRLPFDVIIVNLPDPHTAQLNRFYTQEFFREAAQQLSPGGILSFQVTASENYVSPQLADFLRCLLKTLRSVFPEVAAMPGGTVHFFASMRPGTLAAGSSELLSRLRSRQLQTSYVREYYIPFRMSPDRMLDLQLQIEPQSPTPLNRDFAPIAYYFDVALWSTQFHHGSSRWFEALARVSFGRLAGATALVWLAFVVGAATYLSPRAADDDYSRRPARASTLSIRRNRLAAGSSIAAMGFTLLGLEILLLLGFQALYGYVYQQLAILVALCMVGMAVGTKLGSLHEHPSVPSALQPSEGSVGAAVTRREMLTLAAVQVVGAGSPLLLCGLLASLGGQRASWSAFAVSQVLFPTLAFLSGMLGGFQFPLASRIYFEAAKDSERSLGALYSLDLAGACVGALVLSAYLVPVYGFLPTALLMGVVNLAPACLAVLWASSLPRSRE